MAHRSYSLIAYLFLLLNVFAVGDDLLFHTLKLNDRGADAKVGELLGIMGRNPSGKDLMRCPTDGSSDFDSCRSDRFNSDFCKSPRLQGSQVFFSASLFKRLTLPGRMLANLGDESIHVALAHCGQS